jgi:PAS domain S-box-containing protein
MHPDDVNLIKEKNAQMVAAANELNGESTEEITEFKYRLKHKDGLYRWMQTFSTVFNRNQENKVEDMLNVSVDITESHTLTMELAARNEEIKLKELQHQRMISEVEDYAILLMDKEGFIQNWNKGAEKIKGYSASDIIGKNFRLFYRKEDQDRKLPEMLIQEATEKGKASHEGWRVRKDGTTFWGNIVITALHDESGNLIGFSKVTRNLTERKIAEDTLREYTARIEKHNQELQQINKDLDSFTYMASHDLQEPLRKIRTFCNMILSKWGANFPADISGYFERIIASVTRMQTLIDALLTYSRTTSKEVVLVPTDINNIIEEAKKDLSEVIAVKHVTIKTDKLPVLNVQPLQFQQLFFNLIENAIKYSRPDVPPEIKISSKKFWKEDAEARPLFYRITVRDNGIGFEQQYADTIFKLFQRLHGRSEYSGTGIGLAICKEIVGNHKGTITAKSEPGKGSTFIIELPA